MPLTAPTLRDDLVRTRRGSGADGSRRFRPGLTATHGTPGQASHCAIASPPSAPAAALRVTSPCKRRRLVRAQPAADVAVRDWPWGTRGGAARGGTASRRGRRRWRCASPRYRAAGGDTAQTGTPSGTRLSSAASGVFQVLDSQYGMYVWPCAVVLAQYLWVHRSSLPGKRVLEVPLSDPTNTPFCSAAGASSPFLLG